VKSLKKTPWTVPWIIRCKRFFILN
jgi:hypothetical protein